METKILYNNREYSSVVHSDKSASDYLREIYPEEGRAENFSREITFQLGEACNLACFPSDTVVSTPYGSIDISNISPEDSIYGFDDNTAEKVISKVLSVSKRQSQMLIKINSIVSCTPDHLIFTDKGYKEAQSLELGDKIVVNGDFIHIDSIDIINEPVEVYDLQSSTNNFIANGVYVHNCTYCY